MRSLAHHLWKALVAAVFGGEAGPMTPSNQRSRRRRILRPGTRIARLPTGDLVVGPITGPLVRVRADLIDDVESLLIGRSTTNPALIGLLDEASLLVDLTPLRRLLDGATSRQQLVAGLFAEFGDDAYRRLKARATAGVRIRECGPEPPNGKDLSARLAALGLGAGEAVTVILSDGEPSRSLVDKFMVADRPYLVVAALETTVRLGPLVVPGKTACLRCYDVWRADREVGWQALSLQYARAAGGWGLTPRDPAVLDLALAWAARDIAALADGDQPATWSAVVTVDSELRMPREEIRRQPLCGCCWDQIAC